MTVQVFGGRVESNIRPERKRLRGAGRGGRAIDGKNCASGMGNLSGLGDINDVPVGVRRGFNPHDARLVGPYCV